MNRPNITALLAAALLLALTSCNFHRENLAYFSTSSVAEGTDIKGAAEWKVTIEPDDELMITVASEEPLATAAYNLPLANVAGVNDLQDPLTNSGRVQTYIVNQKGDINFPKLGPLHVAGLTTAQLAEELTQRISKDVEAPMVRVQLLSFKVNVLGEVKNPHIVGTSRERLSMLDAIAAAGDLTLYGRRDNITLIREEDGQIAYHKVNLNDADFINSPYYYLKQNDVVYVEPAVTRKAQAEYNQNNAYKLSVVSTIVSGISVIASLVIALAIK